MRNICIVALLLMISGCSTLSGYDAKSSFSCKAPDGVSCSSLSGVYANAKQNNLPGLQEKKREDKNSKSAVDNSTVNAAPTGTALVSTQQSDIVGRPLNSGDPIYAPSKVLRIWLAPWEDDDGDLHDQSYIYMQAEYGHWLIEHNRSRIMNAYQPTLLPTGSIAREANATTQTIGTGSSYKKQYATPINGSAINQRSPIERSGIDLEDEF